MLWSTLFHKIGKQPLRITQHQQVYALLENPKSNKKEKVLLDLKFNTKGEPYLLKKE